MKDKGPQETIIDQETGPGDSPTADTWIEATVQLVNADEELRAAFLANCVEMGAVGGAEAMMPPEPDAPPAVGNCASTGKSLRTWSTLDEISANALVLS